MPQSHGTSVTPVEIEAPDISLYRRGNTGVPYVVSLDSENAEYSDSPPEFCPARCLATTVKSWDSDTGRESK
jgi:hypothetical protein